MGDFDIDGFLHSNDLSYTGKPEEELKKYKKVESLKVKILEIKKSEQKVRIVLKHLQKELRKQMAETQWSDKHKKIILEVMYREI